MTPTNVDFGVNTRWSMDGGRKRRRWLMCCVFWAFDIASLSTDFAAREKISPFDTVEECSFSEHHILSHLFKKCRILKAFNTSRLSRLAFEVCVFLMLWKRRKKQMSYSRSGKADGPIPTRGWSFWGLADWSSLVGLLHCSLFCSFNIGECMSNAKLVVLTRAEMLETCDGSYGNSEF